MSKYTIKVFVISLTLLLFSGAVFAYTSPGKPINYISDFGEVLSDGQETTINDQLSAYDKQTTNQIFVATVKNLDGDYIENYAVKLFEEWGIGSAENDNGVLLLVSVEDREIKIEVGYGLEPYLVDAQAGRIIRDDIAPQFKEGKYFEGISNGVNSIIKSVGDTPYNAEDANSKRNSMSKSLNIDFNWFFVIPLFIIVLAKILGKSKSWWGGGILGGVFGAVIGIIYGFLYTGVIAFALLIPFGLLMDYLLSKAGVKARENGKKPWWDRNDHWGGGFGGGGFGGGSGFGGGGGGMSGGGGASGRW